jgi:hypothetical protein
MERATLLREVSRRLGDRSLVWAGIRGDDIEPIADLPQLDAVFSIISAYRRRISIESIAYEDISGVRVDLDAWDIDDHLRAEETIAFRQCMLRTLSKRSALLPYRPSRFLSAIWFARRDRCVNLGLFGAHQSAFEHKPWVETAVADLGLPHIPWVYIADEEQLETRRLVSRGPVMLRRSRTSGGEGFVRVNNSAELVAQWPREDEAFVSVSRYLDGGLPVNVGATVWHDGVTVHRPSVQLIGVPNCVTRPFGYCGNDFGLASELDADVLDHIEASTATIGRWLGTFGYRGTFGVDYLLHKGQPLFTEVNPRFQGSTHASSQLSVENGEACLLLEHIAAVLGLDTPAQRPLRDQARDASAFGHIVVHWTGEHGKALDPGALVRKVTRRSHGSRADVLTRPDIRTERGAAVARLTVRDRLTHTGFDLVDPWATLITEWNSSVHSSVTASGEYEKGS